MHICLEGPNGAGKSTLLKKLSSKGYNTLASPNGTELAKTLRPMCRGTDNWNNLSDMVKFLLFSAARYDEFDKLIKNQPSNIITICDRWHFSTWVYQCKLGNIPEDLYEMTINPEEKIDLVIILSGDPEELISRVEKEREKNPSHGKCSWTKEHETMKQISNIYVKELPEYLLVKAIPYVIIDTINKNISEVQKEIEEKISMIKST